ncbi:MAG: hypothetical protein JOZ15_09545 [Acidobacteria bacterium]|nr:hypothetical protein [Acidobacteriota bacterium]
MSGEPQPPPPVAPIPPVAAVGPRHSWLVSRAASWTSVLVPAALLCGFAWLLPKDTFWITDGGNRYIQVQSFDRQGAPEIAYPARHLDPGLRFFPWSGHHFQAVGGRVVSYYLPWFALLSLPGYRLAGAAGLYWLPLAAAIATLLLFPLLLAEVGLAAARAPATLGLGLATPLLFYGLTFWEHSLAVLAALAAVLLLLRAGRRERAREALGAGLLLALSTILREEGYVLTLALLGGLLWAWRAPRLAAALAAGWAAVMAPFWWLQHELFGAALGIHAAAYGGLAAAGPGGGGGAGGGSGGAFGQLGRLLGAKLGDYAFFLLRFHPHPWLSGLLATPFVLVFLAGLRRRRPGRTEALDLCLLGLATAAAAVLVALLLADPRGVFDTLFTQGLLPHSPFLLLALLGLRGQLTSPHRAARFLAAVCTLFALLVVLPLNRADVGIIWGPRHFLVLYPLLVALSLLALRDLWRGAGLADGGERPLQEGDASAGGAAARQGPARRRAVAALAAVLVLSSLAVECQGLRLLALKKAGSERIVGAVRAAPGRAVIVDGYWLAEELAALYFEREVLEVDSDADCRDLLDLLARNGYGEATVVLSRRYGRLSPALIAELRERAVGGRLVFTPGLEFLEVAVASVRLRQR